MLSQPPLGAPVSLRATVPTLAYGSPADRSVERVVVSALEGALPRRMTWVW
ncbi:MAG TPA: hypothetical protein VFJ80_03175 [Candidatus Limnocylindrales bacterium]|nr:hypothetical protein [Candidatus Limnocylindrales bacterium]